MFYRLSNTASRSELEKMSNTRMSYPSLYKSSVIIDGLKENNLTIKTCQNSDVLSIAIWGILPQGYSDQWQTFQNIKNTLNFEADSLKTDQCFKDALYNRRCLVYVTGFFTTYIINSKTYPFYVYLNTNTPFCLAGIYNELDDGFLTCTILVSRGANSINDIQNLSNEVPIVLDKKDAEKWIDSSMDKDEVDNFMDNPKKFLFRSYPISSNFYTEDTFDSNILKPFIFLPHIVSDSN